MEAALASEQPELTPTELPKLAAKEPIQPYIGMVIAKADQVLGGEEEAIMRYFGGSETLLGKQARCIAKNESGMRRWIIGVGYFLANGDWRVTGNSNGTLDQGLFQINDVHWRRFNGKDRLDPFENARVAREIYDEQGWNPWVAKKHCRYLGV